MIKKNRTRKIMIQKCKISNSMCLNSSELSAFLSFSDLFVGKLFLITTHAYIWQIVSVKTSLNYAPCKASSLSHLNPWTSKTKTA